MDRNITLIILALMGCTFIAVLAFIDRASPPLNTTTIHKSQDRLQSYPCEETGQ